MIIVLAAILPIMIQSCEFTVLMFHLFIQNVLSVSSTLWVGNEAQKCQQTNKHQNAKGLTFKKYWNCYNKQYRFELSYFLLKIICVLLKDWKQVVPTTKSSNFRCHLAQNIETLETGEYLESSLFLFLWVSYPS